MNQLYAEAGVKRKENAKSMLIRSLLVFGIIVGGLLMFLGGLFGILGIILVVVLVFIFPRLNVEYEYVFVDGQIDFDRISGKSKRKTVLRIDMEQVDIIAPEGSHSLDSYNNIQCERKDFSSGDKSIKPYVIMANKENKKYRVVFEPNEKCYL